MWRAPERARHAEDVTAVNLAATRRNRINDQLAQATDYSDHLISRSLTAELKRKVDGRTVAELTSFIFIDSQNTNGRHLGPREFKVGSTDFGHRTEICRYVV